MATISAFASVTLDGVMQAPGRADEDARDGFRHGGWAAGYSDEVIGRFAAAGMGTTTALLLGRRTYDDLLGYWTAMPEPNPFTEALVTQPKYVVSRHEHVQPGYPNSTLLAGEAAETVARLKKEVGGALTVLGSGELVRSLHAAGLVDEYVVLVHPIVLGAGTRLFGDGDRVDLSLADSLTSTTGVLLARYRVR
ncbi:dihydrofolate reductase family protein [Prauserella oleivorans]|uniref:Dihydrofolate reductase family protein n=1 Tax=Prauserella oleivorans TaxID=1478153 RepID=A0ABW5W6H9_9PSEU